jgi:hypothetical protein
MEKQQVEGQEGQQDDMRSAVEVTARCGHMCLGSAVSYCLEQGGEHAGQAHMRLMLDCAEICRSTSAFMVTGSPYLRDVCAVCAEICEDCAASCERLGGMEECVQACRECAATCRALAGGEPHLRSAGTVARARAGGREARHS